MQSWALREELSDAPVHMHSQLADEQLLKEGYGGDPGGWNLGVSQWWDLVAMEANAILHWVRKHWVSAGWEGWSFPSIQPWWEPKRNAPRSGLLNTKKTKSTAESWRLEYLSYKERLKKLRLFSLEMWRLRRSLSISLNNC